MQENIDDHSGAGQVRPSDIYREQYAHFRSMNDILYKIPPLFTVALGGLWYFAASQLKTDRVVAAGIFFFCVILSIAFINIMGRFGRAFNGYLDNLNKFDGEYRVTLKPSVLPSTVKTIQLLLWVSAIVSMIGAGHAIRTQPFPWTPIGASVDQATKP
ncbi:hypothetical protein HFO74_33580 [Rhizobium laguerreae]|uniref:DUF2628 domain-containing protein n=1 Tax=Rhizobium laguerreae TaxID=1076926 RepID=A0AB35FRI8_9HYPH|nr:hypothetical protein [Rhizobium laguerreae]MBY3068283.1 hypothetical protein [Rhizobium laguerreae]